VNSRYEKRVRLHLVDGTYELFRAHFSKRPSHASPLGQPLKATVGLASSLLALAHDPDEDVTHIAVAFDNPIRSFRNDMYDGYKTEEGVDPELLAQFDLAETTTRALGMVTWRMDRWEADDALATAAVRFARDVDQVRILTPDKDLGQILQGEHIVQVDRMRQKLIDEKKLMETRGVAPGSVADWLALVGDTADGIPGVPGFGEKTAAALLRAYGHLENIPLDGEWSVPVRGVPRLQESLRTRIDDARLYKKLATLVTDVPLAESLDDLRFRGVPRAAFAAWCGAVGAREGFADRVTRWAT
jgi:5'-3' exonuclease